MPPPPPPTHRFLTTPQVMRLYARCIAFAPPTQPAMLDSAVHSPITHERHGRQADVFRLAGVLAAKVSLNHPFQDGNKRAALYAADMFLKGNGYRLQQLGPAFAGGGGWEDG